MAPPLLLVADAQRLFAETLGISLRYGGFEVVGDHPTTGAEVVALAGRTVPALVLVDCWMPGMTGAAATRAILDHQASTKVIMLSWFHGPNQVSDALAAGVSGFIPKSLPFDRLVDGIWQALAGERMVFAEQLAGLLDYINDRADDSDQRARRLATLTARELEVLQLLCDGHPAKEVAATLHVSVGTFKNHVHRILVKTGARTQLEAINLARHEGLVRETRPPPAPGT